jgi:peptidoglycan L-alanyl-D-glutamate endopeptidase CwlK
MIIKTIASTICLLFFCIQACFAISSQQLQHFKKSYPTFIKSISQNTLIWTDGEQMRILNQTGTNNSPSLFDQLTQAAYPSNKMIDCRTYIPKSDPGRTRNEAFFAKMYGPTETTVKEQLVTVYWMPLYFGQQFPLQVTRINGVNVRLKRVSDELELLVKRHPTFLNYLNRPSAFYWRHILYSDRRSAHSFGIAIDLDSDYASYWIWDTGIKENRLEHVSHFPYRNFMPCDIVSIFENNGFIWGGKWQHYDTMHFEYRPELLSN